MSNTTAYNQAKNAGAAIGQQAAHAVGDKATVCDMKAKQDEAQKEIHKNEMKDPNKGIGDRAAAAANAVGDSISEAAHKAEKQAHK